jgi:3-methyladenine DNA glycosylase Tag
MGQGHHLRHRLIDNCKEDVWLGATVKSNRTKLEKVLRDHPHAGTPIRRRPTQVHPAGGGVAKQLKLQGYRFVGPTSVYAFMQNVGVVNDHVHGCFRAIDYRTTARSR